VSNHNETQFKKCVFFIKNRLVTYYNEEFKKFPVCKSPGPPLQMEKCGKDRRGKESLEYGSWEGEMAKGEGRKGKGEGLGTRVVGKVATWLVDRSPWFSHSVYERNIVFNLQYLNLICRILFHQRL